MTDWTRQRTWDEVSEGDELDPVEIPITVHRLVVEAGANRDFAQIHHNTEVAQAQGAPEMYANNVFIQGWWERCTREFIGLDGRIRKVGPFRMKIFNVVGETSTTKGRVTRKWEDDGDHLVEIEMWTETPKGVSVGPGPVVVSLPKGSAAPSDECSEGARAGPPSSAARAGGGPLLRVECVELLDESGHLGEVPFNPISGQPPFEEIRAERDRGSYLGE